MLNILKYPHRISLNPGLIVVSILQFCISIQNWAKYGLENPAFTRKSIQSTQEALKYSSFLLKSTQKKSKANKKQALLSLLPMNSWLINTFSNPILQS